MKTKHSPVEWAGLDRALEAGKTSARENIDALLFWAIELGATHGGLTDKAMEQLLAAIERAEKWVKQDNEEKPE
jgi:hypothetical protein